MVSYGWGTYLPHPQQELMLQISKKNLIKDFKADKLENVVFVQSEKNCMHSALMNW